MKSARVVRPKRDLKIEQVDEPKPKGKEVLIKVESAGVCHSDIHIWKGGYEGKDGEFMSVEDRGVKFPLTLGHEIAGTIKKVGDSVKRFSEDQRVVVYPWIGDGICEACQVGDEHLCDNPRSLGIYQDGGYSELVLVPDEKYLVDIGDLNADKVSSLACSGLTAYTAIKNSMVSPSQNLAIIGIGGLGLMGVQIAKALCNPTIIAIDVNNDSLKKAKEIGATYTINSRSEDVVKKIKELTGDLGPHAVVDFVNSPKTAEQDLEMLRKRGMLVLVGLFGGSVEINLPLLPMKNHTIVGSYTGRLADLHDLISLVKRNMIDPVVAKNFSLDEAPDAIKQLDDGKIIGRAVLNP